MTLILGLPPGLGSRVHTGHCVRRVRRGGGRVVDERQELVVVHNPGIGDIQNVLRSHLETGSEQHARRIAQVNAIDRRYPLESKSCSVDAELLQERTFLIPINVNLAWVGLLIVESTRLAHRLG